MKVVGCCLCGEGDSVVRATLSKAAQLTNKFISCITSLLYFYIRCFLQFFTSAVPERSDQFLTHAQYKVLLVWFNNTCIPIPKFAQKGIYKLCLIILLRSFCRNCCFSHFFFPAIPINVFPPSLCADQKVLINFCYNKKAYNARYSSDEDHPPKFNCV